MSRVMFYITIIILCFAVCFAQERKLPKGMSPFNTSEMKSLKVEEWEGQLKTLKDTITHLLIENQFLILELQRCGLSIEVSSITCEIKIIKMEE